MNKPYQVINPALYILVCLLEVIVILLLFALGSIIGIVLIGIAMIVALFFVEGE